VRELCADQPGNSWILGIFGEVDLNRGFTVLIASPRLNCWEENENEDKKPNSQPRYWWRPSFSEQSRPHLQATTAVTPMGSRRHGQVALDTRRARRRISV
jgi:hypothetical protein